MGWLIDVLAVFRLSRLVARDQILDPVRERVEARSEFAGEGVACVWCVSVWVAFGVRVLPRWLWRWVRVPLALSAAAGLLDRWVEGPVSPES